jgi:hypothetical protein
MKGINKMDISFIDAVVIGAGFTIGSVIVSAIISVFWRI